MSSAKRKRALSPQVHALHYVGSLIHKISLCVYHKLQTDRLYRSLASHFLGRVRPTDLREIFDYMTSPKVAILFDMFGPYHIARLNALGADIPTLGIEISARSKVYNWNPIQADTAFERLTLFEAADSSEIPTSELTTRIGRALTDWQPDVVFVPGWASRAAFASLKWALANGRPAVVMSESTVEDAVRSPVKEMIKRAMVACFNAGFVGGSRNVAYLRQLGMAKTAIFRGYNAVDNRFFAEEAVDARAELGLRERLGLPGRYLLASARFISIKNLPVLVEAYAQFLASRPSTNLNLVLLGDGEEREVIETLCAELGLKDRVLLPGFRQYEELPSFYGLADGFIHVSSVEPWGLVVNEAMSAGLPVIVSRVCGCADDLVRDGENGFTVNHDDIGQIADAICRLEDAGPDARAAMAEHSLKIVQTVAPERFAAGALAAALTALQRRPAMPGVVRRLVPAVVGRQFGA